MLLCLITTIPRTFFYGSFIQDSVTMVNQAIEKDLPDFKIENGELKADIEQPIQKEEMLFSYLIQIQQISKKYQNKTGLFILKDKVVSIGNGTQTYSYNDLLGTSLEKKICKISFLYLIVFINFISCYRMLVYLFQLFITFFRNYFTWFIG